mmetsp:Transcript_87570/g.152472  ORF Transcript_87570/g.152472 Transcript_87570/m.152472 type:complete len:161 (-) Transcript_87570:30-512(-)
MPSPVSVLPSKSQPTKRSTIPYHAQLLWAAFDSPDPPTQPLCVHEGRTAGQTAPSAAARDVGSNCREKERCTPYTAVSSSKVWSGVFESRRKGGGGWHTGTLCSTPKTLCSTPSTMGSTPSWYPVQFVAGDVPETFTPSVSTFWSVKEPPRICGSPVRGV